MQAVAFNDARALWADLCGLDASNLVDQDKARFLRAFNRAIRRGWEWHWWPDLMRVEERSFRTPYASTTAYAAPTATAATEVYYPATGRYYQALRATTGNAPTSAAYWLESAFDYSGLDWTASTNFLVGAIVDNPDDGRTYACHTAHTSGASFDASKFGVLTPFLPSVPWDQPGRTAIGTPREMWRENPRFTANRTRRIGWEPDEIGVRCTAASVPDRVFLEFRLRCPAFAEGAIDVPAFLQDFAVGGAVVAFLEGEGQLDKALANDTGRLWSHLYDEADKLALMFQSRPRRTRVANL